MTTPTQSSEQPRSTWPNRAPSSLWDRLKTYLIGVGIGAMLLGMFWLMKQQAAQQQGSPSPAPSQSPTSGGTPAPPPSGN